MTAQQRRRRPNCQSLLMKANFAAIAIVLCISAGKLACLAMPQLLVTSNQPKCIKVTSPGGANLKIDYEAPDQSPDSGNAWININIDSASREMFQNRHREARDRFEAPNVNAGPGGWRNPDDPRHDLQQKLMDIGDYKPYSEPINTQSGSITHQTPIGGDLSVCIRANGASIQNPMRFGLRVYIEQDDEEEIQQEKIEHHMGQMEISIMRMQDVMAGILGEADFAKDREMDYHRHVENMNSASIWWPVVQVAVLVLTGFTWASHMTTFFKQKHLI